MANSNARRKRVKPTKPHKDFPLFPHATGRWAKKVRGQMLYFGPWEAPDEALSLWLAQKDDLLAGRKAGDPTGCFTVRDLANHFLTFKKHQQELGEITTRTFDDYKRSCDLLIEEFGKTRDVADLRTDDFAGLRAKLAKSRGPATLHNEIGRIRVVFNFAYQNHHIPEPIRYGASFKRPSKRTLRVARAARGPRLFEAEQIRTLIDAATTQLKCMILLGINGGLGNADVGNLELRDCDMVGEWINYPRPKTGIDRRIPMWPETKQALQDVIDQRSEPQQKTDADIVFVTKYGGRWFKESKANPLSAEFRKLAKTVGVYRQGLGFYALRHTFETIAGGSRDQVVVDSIMGHIRDDMASVYRERIDDDRLQHVSDYVHAWMDFDADTGCID
jgi:integrase